MFKGFFRQERKREKDSNFTQVPHLTREEPRDPPAALPESEDKPNNSSNKTMKETDPGTTSPETNPTFEPETSNPLKDRIRRVRISRLKHIWKVDKYK